MKGRARKSSSTLVLLACLIVACGGGLYLKSVATKAVKPARVIVLFSVEGQSGPIGDLQRSNFTLKEDGRDVANSADWQLSKPDLRGRHRALLLLDYGGRISAVDRAAVANAGRMFVDRMRGVGKVAVYVYDGAAEPHLITPFSEDVPQEDLAKLDSFEATDVSTDLHSAYKGAYDALAAELRKDALGVGAMVVMARGPDRASRVTGRDLQEHLEQSDVQVPRYAVGLGETTREADLEGLSSEEPTYVAKSSDLGKTLYELATKLRTQSGSYYLLSFCSAARAGQHELTLEAKRTAKNEKGEEVEQTGSLSHVFNAEGFGAGCDPNATDDQGAGGGGGAGGAGGAPAATSAVPVASSAPPAPAPKGSGPSPAIPVPQPGGSPK
jgi:hypothetical protein